MERARHHFSASVWLCGSVLVAFGPGRAVGCDAVLADQPSVLDETVSIRGSERAVRSFVAGAAPMLVFAEERGADVELVVRRGTRLLVRADGPILRAGSQRALVSSPGAFVVELIGKEPREVVGRVRLRIVPVAAATACTDAQRLIATADRVHADAKAISFGARPDDDERAADEYKQAVDGYASVAKQLAVRGSTTLRAYAELAAATVLYANLSNWDQAQQWAARSEQSYASLQAHYEKARATVVRGEALLTLALSPPTDTAKTFNPRAAMSQARAMFESLAAYHLQQGEFVEQGQALNDLGMSYYFDGRSEEALAQLQRALAAYERGRDPWSEATTLQNIALAQYEKGHFAEAVAGYQRALRLVATQESVKTKLYILNNLALANWSRGNLDQALRQYSEALQLGRARQDQISEQARSLHGIGAVYQSLGEHDLALSFFNQALTLRSVTLDRVGRVFTLRSIADTLRKQGRAAEALAARQEALALVEDTGASGKVALQIASDLAALGRDAEASALLARVLGGSDRSDVVLRAWSIRERGRLQSGRGLVQAAERDLSTALKVFHDFEIAEEFEVAVELADLQWRRGAHRVALATIDRSLRLAEEIRLQSSNPELRAALMQRVRPAFEMKVSMLVEQSRLRAADVSADAGGTYAEAALMTAEQARSRALEDFRRMDFRSPLAARELARRRELYAELGALKFQLNSRLDQAVRAPQIDELRGAIAKLRGELDQLNARISSQTTVSDGDVADLQDRSRVPETVALIEYWCGARDTTAWIVTRERVEMVALGPTRAIADAARAFHESLRSIGVVSAAERVQHGRQLYDLIIAPIEQTFAAKRTLIFVPDGVLHYVPFASLPTARNGKAHFLVERFDVGAAMSIASLTDAGNRHGVASDRMLLVADPVYGARDPRVSRAKPVRADADRAAVLASPGEIEFARLPGTAAEASAIEAIMRPHPVTRLTGVEATRDRFLQANLGDYRIIHVGSHAVVDADIPQLSALVLSTVDRNGARIDGRVMAADLLAVQFNAQIVVLSACETALGRDMPGEGLMGLRYVVLARGARSVMSSLWQVPDHAASQLMAGFYRALLERNMSAVAASSSAMRDMLAGAYSDSSFWGAFVVTLGVLDEPAASARESPNDRLGERFTQRRM